MKKEKKSILELMQNRQLQQPTTPQLKQIKGGNRNEKEGVIDLNDSDL